MPKDKYLRKNEFRYNTNPDLRNPRGEGHVEYVTVKNKKRYKVNTITHAKNFLGEPTTMLSRNPNLSKPSKKKSNFSVPHWEKESNLKNKADGIWIMSKADRKAIRKFNRKYSKKSK